MKIQVWTEGPILQVVKTCFSEILNALGSKSEFGCNYTALLVSLMSSFARRGEVPIQATLCRLLHILPVLKAQHSETAAIHLRRLDLPPFECSRLKIVKIVVSKGNQNARKEMVLGNNHIEVARGGELSGRRAAPNR